MGAGDNIKKNTQAQREFNAAARDGLSTFRDYEEILGSIAGELGKQKSLTSQARKEYNSLVSISKQLAQQEEDLTRLSDKQLADLGKKATINLAELKILAQKVTYSDNMSDAEIALLSAKENNFKIEEEALEAIKDQIGLRNKSNELLKILSDNEGMLGLSLYPHHLKDGTKCTIESFCEMTAKTAELMGAEKIGIGSDLCLNQPDTIVEWMRKGTWSKSENYGEGSKNKPGFPQQPDWFLDARGFTNIESGLKKVGFSKNEINGILGNNWYNFYKGMN